MSKHLQGNQPVEGPIKPPRKTTAPGKPNAPSLSGPSASVDDGGGAVDYSSRLPGGQFIPRPSD